MTALAANLGDPRQSVPDDPSDIVLSVEGLSLDFRLRNQILHAVRDVSFVQKRGQTKVLVGERGSG